MLRGALPNGPAHTRTDTNSKLLELTDRDLNDEEPDSNDSAEAGDDPETAAALASVITQVAAPGPRPAARLPLEDEDEGRNTWRSKLRCASSPPACRPPCRRAATAAHAPRPCPPAPAPRRNLLCCLVPAPREPYAPPDHGPAVIRPPPLATLPRWQVPVIGPPAPGDAGKKLLILDLDETLVHSSFRPVPSPDFIIPVEIEGRVVDVYVLKRPFVDHFLRAAGARFEVVVFTASLGKYADPLLDLLDRSGVVRWRLFREACVPFEGSYVKDLRCVGRPLGGSLIVDNSPHSYAFQPECAVPIGTFIDDMQDQELLDCLDVLLAVEAAADVRDALPDALARKAAGMPMGGAAAP
jgi:RNA polymerase II subunit A small phosphatase-like protein